VRAEARRSALCGTALSCSALVGPRDSQTTTATTALGAPPSPSPSARRASPLASAAALLLGTSEAGQLSEVFSQSAKSDQQSRERRPRSAWHSERIVPLRGDGEFPLGAITRAAASEDLRPRGSCGEATPRLRGSAQRQVGSCGLPLWGFTGPRNCARNLPPPPLLFPLKLLPPKLGFWGSR
jgi:hypothetical protein